MSAIDVDPGPAEVSAARNMEGGSGFEKLVAHSVYRLAKYQNDERRARQAKKAIAKYKAQQRRRAANVSNEFGANAQLRKDEWKQMDDTLTAVARDNTVGIQTLRDEGIEVPMDIGNLRFEWEDVTDFGEANVDMSAAEGGGEDTLRYVNNGVPLPLVHKSFRINMRRLRASRNRGQPLDTAGIDAATASVSRKLEDILYGGNSITVDGDSISGLTDFTDRQTITGNATWDGASADNMVDDVMRSVEALEDAKAFAGQSGYAFFVARQNYQEVRAKNSGTDNKEGVLELIRRRFESEEDLPTEVSFMPVDRLSEGNAVLVKPTARYMQLPMPADIQVVEWESFGGMVRHFKVMGSVIPALRSDVDGNSGVAHLSGI